MGGTSELSTDELKSETSAALSATIATEASPPAKSRKPMVGEAIVGVRRNRFNIRLLKNVESEPRRLRDADHPTCGAELRWPTGFRRLFRRHKSTILFSK